MTIKASFTSLESATLADWSLIDRPENTRSERERHSAVMLKLLQMQAGEPTHGWPINVYEHSLQTATRALRDGADDQMILCALFHDVTEAFDLADHAVSAAHLIAPFVSDNHVWLVRHHALFQDYHCKTHPKRYSEAREQLRGHPAFEVTALFCERYDQLAFDAGYDTMPLAAFEPIVKRLVLGAPIQADSDPVGQPFSAASPNN